MTEDNPRYDREDRPATAPEHAPANEGEGSRTAAFEYDKRTRRFLADHDPGELAEKARDALDGPEGDTLRKAEDRGRAKARETGRRT